MNRQLLCETTINYTADCSGRHKSRAASSMGRRADAVSNRNSLDRGKWSAWVQYNFSTPRQRQWLATCSTSEIMRNPSAISVSSEGPKAPKGPPTSFCSTGITLAVTSAYFWVRLLLNYFQKRKTDICKKNSDQSIVSAKCFFFFSLEIYNNFPNSISEKV